ncbi:hypothetical protein EGI32_03260 [Ferruginibacter sp. HRS2-29]|nr:hypothetical protein [Ferruginibacter sp. HRS2-29]
MSKTTTFDLLIFLKFVILKMEINFIMETEKLKSLTYTVNLPYAKEYFKDRFHCLDTLDVSIKEHPITDLKNYQQSSHRYDSLKRYCHLKISLYPNTEPEAFHGIIQRCLNQLEIHLGLISK